MKIEKTVAKPSLDERKDIPLDLVVNFVATDGLSVLIMRYLRKQIGTSKNSIDIFRKMRLSTRSSPPIERKPHSLYRSFAHEN